MSSRRKCFGQKNFASKSLQPQWYHYDFMNKSISSNNVKNLKENHLKWNKLNIATNSTSGILPPFKLYSTHIFKDSFMNIPPKNTAPVLYKNSLLFTITSRWWGNYRTLYSRNKCMQWWKWLTMNNLNL